METLLEQRLRRLTSPELGITEPASYVSYAPFDDPKYSHRKLVSLNREPWQRMSRMDPKMLLSPNPFEKSKFRDGFAVWDSAALPQPASAERAGPVDGGPIARLTFENTHLQTLEAMFAGMVGTNEHGQPVRPEGLYAFDLTRMGEMGWLFAEAAHALAHLRCDHMEDSPAFRAILQKTMCNALASLLHGCLFGVPVYVGREAAFGTALAWPATGFSVASVDRPVLQLRKSGWGSPVPDSACVQTLWLRHVEPVPESFVAKTVKAGANDEWSGFPTIMAFAGWDGLDSVIHSRTRIAGTDEYHVMHAGDMLPPERFPELLQLAGWPEAKLEFNDEWVNVPQWIKSKAFLDLVLETPPLPCHDCYIVNTKTPGAPKPPSKFSKRAEEIYEKSRDECIEAARKAAEKKEIGFYFDVRLPRPRREVRLRKNANRRKKFRHEDFEKKKIEKIKAKVSGQIKTPLTEKEREMLKAMKKEPK